MRPRFIGTVAFLSLVAIAVAAFSLLPIQPVQAADSGWVSLFNGKNLDGWYTYLPSAGKNSDPKGVFKVSDGLIHILDIPVTEERQEFGYIATEKEFSDYRIRLEYKWGEKRFPPRATAVRDSGLLYHAVGPDKVWPRMVECQIQEHDTGDVWIVDGVTITTSVDNKEKPKYKPGGIEHTQTDGRIIKSAEYEKQGWNTVEVVVEGDRMTHIINGKVNARAWNIQQPDPNNPGRLLPLTRGRIALQAEGAEVFYRNIRIRPLR